MRPRDALGATGEGGVVTAANKEGSWSRAEEMTNEKQKDQRVTVKAPVRGEA